MSFFDYKTPRFVFVHSLVGAKDLSAPNFYFDKFDLDVEIVYAYYTALWTGSKHYAFPFF